MCRRKKLKQDREKEGTYLIMNTTDPIADMLTRIRNANSSKHKTVDIPASNMKKSIANILLEEGYIKSFEEIKDDTTTQGIIRIARFYDE